MKLNLSVNVPKGSGGCMFFDVADLIEDGIDLQNFSNCIELALTGLIGTKGKEAKYLENMLESMRDDCDSVEESI